MRGKWAAPTMGVNEQGLKLVVPEPLASSEAGVVLPCADPLHHARVITHEAEVRALSPIDDRIDFFDRKWCSQVGAWGVAATAPLPPAIEAMKVITL